VTARDAVRGRGKRAWARPSRTWSFGGVLLVAACRGGGGEGAEPAPSAAPVVELPSAWQQPRETLLTVGELAPDFVAIAHTGHRVRLSQFLERPSVVYFYPADRTPGCTAEAQGIRDAWLRFRDRVGMVFGVSTDDNVSHRDFASEHGLPFLLLSDADHAIAASFGVPIVDGRAQRVTFVIGTDRKVTRVFDAVQPEGHAEEILTALDELTAPAAP
jgi:thioredoxin-dependent peroxiredoxin